MSKKNTLADDVDVSSTLRTLKKWLNSFNIKADFSMLDKDISPGLRHGVLFLHYLHCQNYPQAVTPSEQSLLKVLADLHLKVNPEGVSTSEKPDGMSSKTNAPSKFNSKVKAKNEKVDDGQEKQKQNQKLAGPKKGARKLAPLANAMNKLNIQDNKGCGCKGDCKTKSCGCRKRDEHCSAVCKCSQGCVNKSEEVKIKGDSVKTGLNKEPEQNEEPEKEELEQDEDSTDEDTLHSDDGTSSEDVETRLWMKENVDWNEHIASLEKCPKCQRNFRPSRIEYHAKVCIKV